MEQRRLELGRLEQRLLGTVKLLWFSNAQIKIFAEDIFEEKTNSNEPTIHHPHVRYGTGHHNDNCYKKKSHIGKSFSVVYLCGYSKLERLVNKRERLHSEIVGSPLHRKLCSLHYRKGTNMYKTNPLNRLLFVIIAVLMIVVLPTVHASAALVKCRTDPIFLLSTGDTLNVTLDISADAANVRNVTYIVHVPAGVTVKKVTYTAGGLGTKEMYKVYQDRPVKTYTTDTVVTTQNTGSVAVVATMVLNKTYSASTSGYNGQHLIVTVSKP